MKIAVDLDGPVVNFNKAFCEYYNMRFGLDDDWTQYDNWNIYECSNTEVTKEQIDIAWKEFRDIRMFAALELVPGAKEGLCSLSGMGHELIYVTARPQSAHRTTAKYIVKAGLPLDGLLFADKEKGDVAAAMGCEIAIDDKPENCLQFKSKGIFTFLWITCYSHKWYHERLVNNSDEIKRVIPTRDWKYIVMYIREKIYER